MLTLQAFVIYFRRIVSAGFQVVGAEERASAVLHDLPAQKKFEQCVDGQPIPSLFLEATTTAQNEAGPLVVIPNLED